MKLLSEKLFSLPRDALRVLVLDAWNICEDLEVEWEEVGRILSSEKFGQLHSFTIQNYGRAKVPCPHLWQLDERGRICWKL